MRMLWLAGALAAMSTAAAAQPLSITGVDCRALAKHMPRPDVAYQPGVDARGRKVAPADLNDAPQIRVPDVIAFDAAADLRRFGVPPTSPLFQPHVGVGRVEVHPDGRVLFNGVPLGDPDVAALEEFCRARLPRGG